MIGATYYRRTNKKHKRLIEAPKKPSPQIFYTDSSRFQCANIIELQYDLPQSRVVKNELFHFTDVKKTYQLNTEKVAVS